MPLLITELCLLGVVARNLVRSAICFIHAQWDLNLASTETNEFSESQPNVPGISFVSLAFDKRLQCLAGTPPENLMNIKSIRRHAMLSHSYHQKLAQHLVDRLNSQSLMQFPLQMNNTVPPKKLETYLI